MTSTELAVKRVMDCYGMLVRLSIEEEQAARKRVSEHLSKSDITDENQLAVEGIKFLRGEKPTRRRQV
jgi:hypothetical protein